MSEPKPVMTDTLKPEVERRMRAAAATADCACGVFVRCIPHAVAVAVEMIESAVETHTYAAHRGCKNAHGCCVSCHEDVDGGYSQELVCCAELHELESRARAAGDRAEAAEKREANWRSAALRYEKTLAEHREKWDHTIGCGCYAMGSTTYHEGWRDSRCAPAPKDEA